MAVPAACTTIYPGQGGAVVNHRLPRLGDEDTRKAFLEKIFPLVGRKVVMFIFHTLPQFSVDTRIPWQRSCIVWCLLSSDSDAMMVIRAILGAICACQVLRRDVFKRVA